MSNRTLLWHPNSSIKVENEEGQASLESWTEKKFAPLCMERTASLENSSEDENELYKMCDNVFAASDKLKEFTSGQIILETGTFKKAHVAEEKSARNTQMCDDTVYANCFQKVSSSGHERNPALKRSGGIHKVPNGVWAQKT